MIPDDILIDLPSVSPIDEANSFYFQTASGWRSQY